MSGRKIRTRCCLVSAVLFFIALAGGADGQQPFQIVATVSRVKVDVIVTNEQGFVEGLDVLDFSVWEDGQPVEVLSAQLVDVTAARIPSAEVVAAAGDSIKGSQSAVSQEAGPGAVIFLIDGPSLTGSTKARFANAWLAIENASRGGGVPRAAYFVDDAGQLLELTPLTLDPERLALAADRVAALPTTRNQRSTNLIDLVSGLPQPGQNSFVRPSVAQRAALSKARVFESQERARALATYEILTVFCDALWRMEGRKTLVWVSSGVNLMSGGPYLAALAAYADAVQTNFGSAGEDLIPGFRQLRAEQNDPDDRVLQLQQRLHEAANSANVSIYALDPTPLIEARLPSADARMGANGFRQALTDSGVIASLDRFGDSLRNAAEATGGEAFVHVTDVDAALRDIESAASRYYLLTYAPPRSAPDGVYHEIRVDVDRPGVRVRARNGYVHLTEAGRRERNLTAARALPGLMTRLPGIAHADQPVVAEGPPPEDEPVAAREVVPIREPAAIDAEQPLINREDLPTSVPETASLDVTNPASYTPELQRLLAGLAGTARLHRANALSFSSNETITESHFRIGGNLRKRAVHELRYIYTLEYLPDDVPPGTPRRLRDYRIQRSDEIESGETPEEVRLEDLNLVMATQRAYSWAFLFQEGLQPYYRFELTGEERVLDRSAVIISFEPIPPLAENLNDWFGRAWIDAETFQVLRVEALQAGDYARLDEVNRDRLRLRVPTDGRLVVRLIAEFGLELRGVRLPTKVSLVGEDFSMRQSFGIPSQAYVSRTMPEWELRGRIVFRVDQVYDDYRVFNVEVRR